MNKTTGNSPGEPLDSDALRPSAPGNSEEQESAAETLRRPSDPVDAGWSEEAALPAADAAGPVDAETDPESIPDEVTPPIAVAPRFKFSEQELEREVTQELSPEELDIQPLPVKAKAAAVRHPTPPGGLHSAPITQLTLSDLFDSSPPPGSVTLEPPNVLEFSSSRPPPGVPSQQRPVFEPIKRPTDAGSGVVALPSIPVLADSGQSALDRPSQRPEPSVSTSSASASSVSASAVPTNSVSANAVAASAVAASAPRLPASSPPRPGNQPAAAPAPARENTPLPPQLAAVPAAQSPTPTAAEPARPGASSAAAPRQSTPAAGKARSSSAPAPSAGGKPSFESKKARAADEAKSVIAAPAALRQPQRGQLPSVVLAPSLEAESEGETVSIKALRATRATMRISSAEALGLRKSLAPPQMGGGPVSSSPAIRARPLSPASLRALALGAGPRVWIGVGCVLAALLVLWAVWPSKGGLLVTVSGPGGAPLPGVQVFVDGQAACSSSPCSVAGLPRGVHFVRASAEGMGATADESVNVEPGSDAVHNIRMLPPAGSESGGIQVGAAAEPIKLYIDGKLAGDLPQKVLGLAVGEHWLKFEPASGAEPFEKQVILGAAEILQVDPTAPASDKALVTIRLSPESEGATVTLNDDFLLDFPAELELAPNAVYELKATKPGFKDFATQIRLSPAERRKLIDVELEPSIARARAARSAPTTREMKDKLERLPIVGKPPEVPTTAAPAVSGTGTLNISSNPPSSVILNGRPLGMTPQMGVVVPAGQMQTLIFVHPKMGRRKAQAVVPPGKSRSVAIRFQ